MQSPRSKLFQRRGKKMWSSRGWVLFCIWLVEMWVFETDHRAKRRKAKVIPVTFDTRFELLTTNRYSKSGKRVKTWITKTRLLLVLHLIFWEAGAIFLQNQSNPGLVSTLNKKLPFDTVPHCVTQRHLLHPRNFWVWCLHPSSAMAFSLHQVREVLIHQLTTAETVLWWQHRPSKGRTSLSLFIFGNFIYDIWLSWLSFIMVIITTIT